MIKIYCFATPIMIVSSHAIYYFTTTIDFKKVFFISITRYGLFFCFVVYVFFLADVSIFQFVIMHLFAFLASSIVGLYFLISSTYEYKWNFNPSVLMKLFHFGKFTYGVGISSIMTRSIDQFMIGLLLNNESVATYNLARRFLNILEVPITAVSSLALPKLAHSTNEEDPKKSVGQVFERTTGIGVAIILPVVLSLILFPHFFIKIVAGELYFDAAPALQILIFYNLFQPIATQSGGVLEVSGKPHIGLFLLLINIVFNTGLNYFLIRDESIYGGVVGASIATFISGFIYLALLVFFIKKECDFSILRILKNVFGTYRMILKLIYSKIKS